MVGATPKGFWFRFDENNGLDWTGCALKDSGPEAGENGFEKGLLPLLGPFDEPGLAKSDVGWLCEAPNGLKPVEEDVDGTVLPKGLLLALPFALDLAVIPPQGESDVMVDVPLVMPFVFPKGVPKGDDVDIDLEVISVSGK